ncbi:unnamed protein product [Calypogeia fissa]
MRSTVSELKTLQLGFIRGPADSLSSGEESLGALSLGLRIGTDCRIVGKADWEIQLSLVNSQADYKQIHPKVTSSLYTGSNVRQARYRPMVSPQAVAVLLAPRVDSALVSAKAAVPSIASSCVQESVVTGVTSVKWQERV